MTYIAVHLSTIWGVPKHRMCTLGHDVPAIYASWLVFSYLSKDAWTRLVLSHYVFTLIACQTQRQHTMRTTCSWLRILLSAIQWNISGGSKEDRLKTWLSQLQHRGTRTSHFGYLALYHWLPNKSIILSPSPSSLQTLNRKQDAHASFS